MDQHTPIWEDLMHILDIKDIDDLTRKQKVD